MKGFLSWFLVLFNYYRPKDADRIVSVFEKKVNQLEKWADIMANDIAEIERQKKQLDKLKSVALSEEKKSLERADKLRALFN